MTDDWKADVERQLGQLHGDVRLLLAALIAGFLILAGGGWMLHQSTSAQIQQQAVTLARIEGKIDAAAETRRLEPSADQQGYRGGTGAETATPKR
ncbi:hypothetical protein [Sphingomonas sp. IW22]|uniref:hypothetical protein n=1 Tax=Sphingomonas sp. IW22 TaxID=3242489 RepID=UPI0035225984